MRTLPEHDIYTICNPCGGCGKTTLAYNLSYLLNNVLAIDGSYSGNLSFCYDRTYWEHGQSIYDIVMPYITPNIKKNPVICEQIGKRGKYFKDNVAYFIPSSKYLEDFIFSYNTALRIVKNAPDCVKDKSYGAVVYSLRNVIDDIFKKYKLEKCIIDTSSIMTGMTTYAICNSDALIVPIRADFQSYTALNNVFKFLEKHEEVLRTFKIDKTIPKVHMVIIIEMCDQTGNVFVPMIKSILNENKRFLTTDNPEEHIFGIENFGTTGYIANENLIPITALHSDAIYEMCVHNKNFIVDFELVKRVKNQFNAIVEYL